MKSYPNTSLNGAIFGMKNFTSFPKQAHWRLVSRQWHIRGNAFLLSGFSWWSPFEKLFRFSSTVWFAVNCLNGLMCRESKGEILLLVIKTEWVIIVSLSVSSLSEEGRRRLSFQMPLLFSPQKQSSFAPTDVCTHSFASPLAGAESLWKLSPPHESRRRGAGAEQKTRSGIFLLQVSPSTWQILRSTRRNSKGQGAAVNHF